jgi:cytochrome c oxidase subunit 3
MSGSKLGNVAHHFENAYQQFSSAKLGMWLFIVQEILFFSALFVAYAVYRGMHPEMFVDAHHHLSWKMGGINTLVLIFSSFTMAMSIRTAQLNQRLQSFWYLGTTLFCSCIFMVIKFFEYAEKIHHGYLPSVWFSGEGIYETMHIFFGIYFTMTGLHGLHVLVGMGLIIWLMLETRKGKYNSEYFTPVEMVGLYWHLVDLIWIFLFPLLYLIG